MKRLLISVAVASIAAMSAFAGSRAIRVGTYNIRYSGGDRGTPNEWAQRKDDLVALVKSLDLDVCGMQEVQPDQLQYLRENMPGYEFVGKPRNADGKTGEASPVFYRTDRFDAEKSGVFWLSETPDEPGSKGWGANLPRVCTYMVLRDRRTGQRLCFANTHTDHRSAEAREKGIELIIRRMEDFGNGCPIVFVGDHNCPEADPPALAASKVLDNALYKSETPPAGPWRSFTAWQWRDAEFSAVEAMKLDKSVRNARKDTPEGETPIDGMCAWERCGRRIDYVYVSHGVRVLDYATVPASRPGQKLYPSDHFPIVSTIALPDDAKKPLKVLMIGNSFSASVLHVTPKVAEACGLKMDFVNCNIGGCTLKQHWENVEKASDPEFRPYLAMFGTPDSEAAKAVRAVCADGKTNIPQMLDAARWDVVTIQQGSVGSPFADTYQPYADNLIATIRKHAPQAEILIQETWAYLPYHKKLGEWEMTQREMYDRLHENYGALAKKTGFRIIPTGTAVERYRAKLPPFRKLSKAEWDAIEEPNLPDIFGDPCGVPKWRKPYRWEKGFDPDKVQLMIDSTHLNSDGEYLQACVWLSVLCGIDARKIGWTPEGLAPDRAALMRECAHEAVESAAAQPRKEVLASSFGWNPEDATKCLQSAIDSGAAKVVVDRQASEWLVETIRVPSDVELVFADGVVVRAKPGSMAGKTDCLFRVQNASNVVIRGEGRARLAMNRSDYLDPSQYRHSEYRHLLSLRNVSNVTVRNLALEESGGDGVYLLKARNILLEDLVCRGHNRQGTSLIDGGDIVIRNCVFSETKGALPECGMDIEPARSTFSVGRVLVDNCLFCSNNCSGLAINVSHLRENCGAMDVTYRNCRFFDNAQRGIWTIFSGGHGAPVKGRVSFEGCEVWNNRSGPLQVANLETDGVEVRFERCRFDAVGMARSGSPIVLNNGGVKSDMNNLSFADCTLACSPKTAPVSFGAMTGCGVVPGGVKGVLRIEYTDGTSGSYDFAELERKYVPQPELRRFETGVVDVSKLVAANPDGRPKAAVFAGYRGPFTFLQAVPGPGSYPIRFMSKPLGKRRSVAVQVEVFDPAGTPHDAFTVTEQDFVYELKTTARAGTIYRFQVKPSGSRVVLSSETPGHGFAATDRVHWLTGRGENIYFQARAGAGDVKVELTMSPHEPVTAELIAPDGTVVDRCENNDSGVILCGKRAPDAPSEIWRMHVTRFVDDCKIRLGAATTGVYAYDPDMILVERTSPSASVPVANAPAGERLFPADVTNVCITSVSSIIDKKSFDKGTNLLVRCGYRLKVMPNVLGPNVAPAAERARLFEEAWLAPDTDLILFARGGKGAEDVLPLIDWEKLSRRDMRVIGFSDVTLVVNAMLAKGAGHPYSGPMLTSMSRWNGDSRKWFGEMMNGRDMPPLKVRVLKGGAARGCPMGGHVMRMLTLSKTPFMPSAAGRVVFFECTARNSADTVTNALMELRDGGFLKGATAVVFADFQHSGEERRRLDAFFDEFAKTLPCPVFADFPYGHMDGSRLLDFRREVHISPDGVITWEANGGSGEVPLKMQNIAHRGMWDNCVPQNTVEAIRRAYESGATWVETDFHHTKAGQVVCIHMERELERYTGCKKKIEDLSPEDIATLDLGARDGLGRTYRIPLLAQVLAVVPSNGVLQAEIKGYTSEYADIFDNAVKKAGLSEKNIVVSSFQYDALKDFKARYPQYRTVWLVSLPKGKAFDVQKWVAKAKDAGFEVFCPGCGTTRGVMTRADADAVRAAGLEFRMYGVNSRDDLEQAKALGAAGFTCNFWREAFAWADEVGGVELVK